MPWAIASGLLDRYPDMKDALESANLMDGLRQKAEEAKMTLRRKALLDEAAVEAALQSGERVSKDILELRRVQTCHT